METVTFASQSLGRSKLRLPPETVDTYTFEPSLYALQLQHHSPILSKALVLVSPSQTSSGLDLLFRRVYS